jgi:hypothetical protein
MKLKNRFYFNDLRDLTPTPALSPLRGEGAAIGSRHYFFFRWHIDRYRFMAASSAEFSLRQPGNITALAGSDKILPRWSLLSER